MALKNFMAARGERDEQGGAGAARLPAPSERPPRTVAPSTSIDATSELKGTLRCKETLRIDGRVKGEVVCDKTVLIGEGAKVHASIVADTVQVSGEVRGNITARCKITLDRTARVTGNLATPGIVIEEGAKLEGRIVIGSEEKPDEASKPAGRPSPEAKTDRTAPKAAAPPPA
jgi:cytoskeletal protein CcmA (bactofilin family)